MILFVILLEEGIQDSWIPCRTGHGNAAAGGRVMEKGHLDSLVDRCGEAYVSTRLQIQVKHAADVLGPGLGSFHFENAERALVLFGGLVKLLGGWKRGIANITDHRIVINRGRSVVSRKPSTGSNCCISPTCIWTRLQGWANTLGNFAER